MSDKDKICISEEIVPGEWTAKSKAYVVVITPEDHGDLAGAVQHILEQNGFTTCMGRHHSSSYQ